MNRKGGRATPGKARYTAMAMLIPAAPERPLAPWLELPCRRCSRRDCESINWIRYEASEGTTAVHGDGELTIHRCPAGRWWGRIPMRSKRAAPMLLLILGERELGKAQFAGLCVTEAARFNGAPNGSLPEAASSPVSDPLAVLSNPLEQEGRGVRLEPLVRRVIVEVRSRYRDPRTSVRQLGELLEVHPNYLSHIFATHTGVHLKCYINLLRVRLACRLLRRTRWQMKRIASTCGFHRQDWFNHAFKNVMSVTPVQYRQRST